MYYSRLAVAFVAICAFLASPDSSNGQAQDSANASPVAYASVNELNNILGQLKQTSQNMQADLAKMRIEKWKTDSSTKRQTQSNVESIQRNLQSALPDVITQLNNAPEDVAVGFRLYRNLDALYDVFGSVLESAGAFGSKDEFQSLTNDMNSLEAVRRSFADRMQTLATGKEAELSRLRGQVKALLATPPAPPKKVVVDDTEPPKKPAKKRTTKPTTPAASTAPKSTPASPNPQAAAPH